MTKHITNIIFGALVLAMAFSASSAYAQEAADGASPPPVDIIPASSMEKTGASYDDSSHTHPPIKLTPDKSELLRLDQPAGSIIIGNPNHLSILADTSQILVLIPRVPGATHFTILDREGNVMMQRHAIIASPQEKYIRVRNSCAGAGDAACETTQVFYCPDMCHKIALSNGEEETSSSQTIDDSGDTVDIDTINVEAEDQSDE
jgi:hypothetical protein